MAVSQQQIEVAPLDLGAVVQSSLSALDAEIKDKKGRIEAAPPWPRVLGHRETLAHVLMNLISNALKFTARGVAPIVRVRAEEIQDRVRVWVEDNGVGIAPQYQEQIFRIFRRLQGRP